jgi:transcription-repair coupling factor (superfamily II helicase)
MKQNPLATMSDGVNRESEVFRSAVRFLARERESGGVYGLKGSGPAFMIAAAVREGRRPMVSLSPDPMEAFNRAGDVNFYIGADGDERRMIDDSIIHYPSSDVTPFSAEGFELDLWTSRTAALFRLTETGPPKALFLSVEALMRKVPGANALRKSGFTISVNDELNREELLEKLTQAGYSRAPLVEDVGDFSVRGFIIDIFPPLYSNPVRIEQLGDMVESIRFFDPSDQRSKGDLSQALVGPVHMFIPDDDEMEAGLARILAACEERGVEKPVRRRILDNLKHRIRFPGSDIYLPYFFRDMGSILDLTPQDITLVLPDEDTLIRSLDDQEEEILQGWENAAKQGFPIPEPGDLYFLKKDILERLKDFRRVQMSPLEIEGPEDASYRLSCSSNTDIRQELSRGKTVDSGVRTLVSRLTGYRDNAAEVFLVSHTMGQANRLMKLLEPYEINLDFRGEGFDPSNLDPEPSPGIRLYVGDLSSGFRLLSAGKVVITEEEIFGSRVKAPSRKRRAGALLSSLADLSENEPVVHEDYGIGVFRGLIKKEFEGVSTEVMVIEFAGGDLLYHPVERLQVIQKFASGEESPPRIDRLGGKGWVKTKAKVKESLKEIAHELLRIYAKREITTRPAYAAPDEQFAGFEAGFEFEETPDQAKAIENVMISMDQDSPMDHLVCGDVGYGKTEVALRAAFRAIMDGKQVAVLTPTTVLAQQHYETFRRRFTGYPIEVDNLSRFRAPSEQKRIINRLKEGKIDIIIATHRLLGKDVEFKDLGLLVVDEEQRFGVTHKEKIKKFRAGVDVLTLTATPIPRTLNLALAGLRDLSLIETPPTNRRSIRTYVMRQSDDVVREAVLREIRRGGQVFYVHNRVKTIFKKAAWLKELAPEASIGVAHGQMADKELERVMLDFVSGDLNCLVCTSIIESGLDIPRANTMLIERADTFGLADLYQLRGRVGRSQVRAYAYFLTPSESLMTPDAIKRLAVIQEHSELGQGFRIAMRDMEIRGAGNILGASQSGHVALVGYEMYMDLLEQAIQEIKGESPPKSIDPEIGLKLEALIPDDYVPDPKQRMNLYKRLSRAADESDIETVEDEMLDRYGKAPPSAGNLLALMRIRALMKKIFALKLDYNGKDLIVGLDPDTPIDPGKLIAWAQNNPKQVRLLPGDRITYKIGPVDDETRIHLASEFITGLVKIADLDGYQQNT